MAVTFPAYTQPLFSGGPSSAGVNISSNAVPTGEIWVVQSVCFFSTLAAYSFAGFIWISDGESAPICGLDQTSTVGGEFYEFGELRQAVVAGDILTMRTNGNGWRWRVTGYVLTA